MSSAATQSFTALAFEEIFRAHERFIWGLCYRMTGNAADADDLAQETFVRAWERPPARTGEPWRPWLVRVAMNLSRDLLRRRKRRRYEGPWLPSPIETGDEFTPPSYEPVDDEGNPAARYDMLESVSFAFLLALEALTPAQRAVLLLRDVFDYSVRETAAALDMSEANVKTTHLRARRAMAAYERERLPPSREVQQQTRDVLERFLTCLGSGDAAGVASLLAEDVRSVTDAGGEFHAARVAVLGRDKVTRLCLGLMKRTGAGARLEFRTLNGLPALVIEIPRPAPGIAPRSTIQLDLDRTGRLRTLYGVVASR